jgi:hypothetical protein
VNDRVVEEWRRKEQGERERGPFVRNGGKDKRGKRRRQTEEQRNKMVVNGVGGGENFFTTWNIERKFVLNEEK